MKEQTAKYVRSHGSFLGRYGSQHRLLNRLGTALYDELVRQIDGYCDVEIVLLGSDARPRLNIIFYLNPPKHLMGKLLRSEWVFFLDPRTISGRMHLDQAVRQMVSSAKNNLYHIKEATKRIELEAVNA